MSAYTAVLKLFKTVATTCQTEQRTARGTTQQPLELNKQKKSCPYTGRTTYFIEECIVERRRYWLPSYLTFWWNVPMSGSKVKGLALQCVDLERALGHAQEFLGPFWVQIKIIKIWVEVVIFVTKTQSPTFPSPWGGSLAPSPPPILRLPIWSTMGLAATLLPLPSSHNGAASTAAAAAPLGWVNVNGMW